MQEEVEQRIVSLMISCGKLGEQEFRKAVAKLLEQLKSGHQKHQYSKANPHGKMTVKQLAAKDKGLQSIEVTDQNIGSFNRIARKYGIDFAPSDSECDQQFSAGILGIGDYPDPGRLGRGSWADADQKGSYLVA